MVNALVYKNLQYDPLKDLIPVTLAVRFPLVVVVNPDAAGEGLRRADQPAQGQSRQVQLRLLGRGHDAASTGELLKSMAGVDLVHVPYRGNSAIMADLLAGRVAMMFDGPPTQLGNIQSGKVRAFAITTAERSPVLPDVPPVADTLPGYAIPFWTAIFAPAGTPEGDRRADRGRDQQSDAAPRGGEPADARSASPASDRARRSSTASGASSSTTSARS